MLTKTTEHHHFECFSFLDLLRRRTTLFSIHYYYNHLVVMVINEINNDVQKTRNSFTVSWNIMFVVRKKLSIHHPLFFYYIQVSLFLFVVFPSFASRSPIWSLSFQIHFAKSWGISASYAAYWDWTQVRQGVCIM